MPPTSAPSIAIIGGGISGPALALSLKKHHGIISTIYELQPDGDERGVNIALAANAVRVLQHLGVYHELYKDGFSYEELRSQYGLPCLRTHRAKVQKALLKELKAQGIVTYFGKKLVSLKENEAIVEMQFEDGTTAGANFVIGADGVHSRVRDLIMDVKMDYSGFMGIIEMSVQKPMIHESINKITLPNFIFGKTGFVALMPSNYEGTEERFGKEWPEYVTRLDSAHAFTPQAGQGAAVGLEDAETLAYTLSRDGFINNHLHLLKIWEAHRKERLVLIKRLTDLNGRLRSPDTSVVQYMKEWAMWANFKWTGPRGGLEWLFSYNAEDILRLL
ncbi:FAD-dependent urate hydroxylase-like protein [Cladobotryum mycophilum]|uniref:FAD-dependent urate hydroxylase-like protein n=1 Tax=Cladobotryum mycophilum TaxID=491253 RepID=A0ABR0S7Y4_9HYPO